MMRRRGFLRDTRAVAAAELALILPGIAFVLLNVVDLGIYIYSKMQVDLAAQEAVGIARVVCDEDGELPATVNCSGLDTTMTDAAQTTSLSTGVTLSGTEEAYFCADSGGTLTPESGYAVDGTVPDDCDGVVSGSTSAPGLYIRTTASYTFSPVFPGASVASALPATITRTAWMRLQ